MIRNSPQKPHKLYVPSIYLNALYEYLLDNDHELSTLHNRFNTCDKVIESLKSTVQYSVIVRVLDYIHSEINSSSSLHECLAPYIERAFSSLFTSLLLSSKQVKIWLNCIIKYSPIFTPMIEISLYKEAHGAQLVQFKKNNELPYSTLFQTLARFSFHCTLFQFLDISPNTASKNTSINQKMTTQNLSLKKNINWIGISLSPHILNTPSPLSNRTVFKTVTHEFEEALIRHQNQSLYSSRIKNIINRHLHNYKKITLNDISDTLNMSPRSLSRLLNKEHYTFQQCLDECLCQKMNELSAQGIRKKQIALKLGFKSLTGMYSLTKRCKQTDLKE